MCQARPAPKDGTVAAHLGGWMMLRIPMHDCGASRLIEGLEEGAPDDEGHDSREHQAYVEARMGRFCSG